MAKANLPVNFKDDILKENMNGKRRFNMIQNSDGTVSFEDVTDYTQVGSTFGAAQINATNEAVNNAADASKIIDSLETIKANTQSGYFAGALAVKELSSNLGNYFVLETRRITGARGYRNSSGSASWDVKNIYPRYQNLTAENFYVNGNCSQTVTQGSTSSNISFTYSKNYNAQTGILTVSVTAANASFEWSTLNSAFVTPILLFNH